MKERLGQIARGEIKYEKPDVLVEPGAITETLTAGYVYHRELMLVSRNKVPMRGLIYSNCRQVELSDSQFSGNRCRLSYTVHGTDLLPGTTLSGAFLLVMNGSEREIPFTFEISAVEGMQAPIRTIEDFVGLAEQSGDQALQLFLSADFTRLSFMKDLRTLALYEGVRKSNRDSVAMIEFLRGMGYVQEQEQAEQEQQAVQPEKTHRSYSSLAGLEGMEPYRHLMDLLLEYQCRRYPAERLIPEMEREAVRLTKVYPNETFPNLMRAFLSLEGGYRTAAEKLLEDLYPVIIDRRGIELENYCFYLFLRIRLGCSEEQEATIVRLFRKYQQDWSEKHGLFFLLMQADRTLSKNTEALLSRMKAEYVTGLKSPFLYAEALRRYNGRPDLLQELGAFEREVLFFGLAYGADTKPVSRKTMRHTGRSTESEARIRISEELAEQVGVLAYKERRYQTECVELLTQLYEEFPLESLLRAITGQLILGGKSDADAFGWYEKALKQSVSLTGLYEAYLRAIPEHFTGALPREIVLFYSYGNHLSEELQEVLYSNILRCYETGSEEYEMYREQMEQFAIIRLLKGRISSHLAPIYQHILCQEMVDERLSAVLPDLLFAKQIYCPLAGMERLRIRYPEFVQEIGVPMNGTQDVCCPIYTEDALLMFVDRQGNRHICPDTTVRPLMEDQGLLERCRQWESTDPMLNLLSCREAMSRKIADVKDWGLLSAASGDAGLHPMYRQRIIGRLLRDWKIFEGESEAADFLLQLDAAPMYRKERARYLELLTEAGEYEKACRIAGEFGYTGISSDRLQELVRGRIGQIDAAREEILLELCLSLYRRNQADDVILGYICRHYNSGTAEMCRILERAIHVRAKLWDLPERLLAQMLFCEKTEGIDQVFYVYAAQSSVYHILVQAFFVWKCYRYLSDGETLPDYFYEYLEKYWKADTFVAEGAVLCAAVLLEHEAESEISEERYPFVQKLTDQLCAEGRYFTFFEKLPKEIRLSESLNGCRIVEYRSGKEGEYLLNYELYPEKETSGYLNMRQVCAGVYALPVILFEGEWMSASIIRRSAGQEEVLLSDVMLRGGNSYCIEGSRYGQLNHIGKLLEDENEDAITKAEQELEEIRMQEELLKELLRSYQ